MVSPYRYRIPLPDGELGGPPLTFASLDQALDWCEMERANLLAATRLAAVSGLYELAWQLPTASLGFFNRRTYWADWVETHQIALASVRQLGDRRGEAMVLNNLGMGYARRRLDDAIGCFEQAMDIRREIGDLPGEAQTAANLADTYLRIDRVEEALDLLQRALDIHRQQGHQYGEGVALNNLGEAFLASGRAEQAIGPLGQARDIFARIGELRGEGYALTNLGEAYLALAEPGALPTACSGRWISARLWATGWARPRPCGIWARPGWQVNGPRKLASSWPSRSPSSRTWATKPSCPRSGTSSRRCRRNPRG